VTHSRLLAQGTATGAHHLQLRCGGESRRATRTRTRRRRRWRMTLWTAWRRSVPPKAAARWRAPSRQNQN